MSNRPELKSKFKDEKGDYRKLPINWSKIVIVWIVIILVIGIAVAIWGWGIGGFKYLKGKRFANDLYENIYVDHNYDLYMENHDDEFSTEAKTTLKQTNDLLTERDYTYSKNNIVEISNKVNRNDVWLAVTDKNVSQDVVYSDEQPMPTVFIHETFTKDGLFITGVTKVYE